MGKMIAAALVLSLAACGEDPVNPPTEPAAPVPAAATGVPETPGAGGQLPGSGPQSFVGRWAADVAWCPNTEGPERPIMITTTRFEGYENTCAIDAIDERTNSYTAELTCTAEGVTSQERVRFAVDGQRMTLTYLDRDGAQVQLIKCTTLAETSNRAPEP